jgi:methylenetetrahydrofolate dehydrogenase (NADP+)/methenyltetrahydrofolate cyclohydrolase
MAAYPFGSLRQRRDVYITHLIDYGRNVATIIDGKKEALTVRAGVAEAVKAFRERHRFAPGLATLLVGDDAASAAYVRSKHKACAEVGIESVGHVLPASSNQAEILDLVATLNRHQNVHGILVQLPLPDHIDEQVVIEAIEPRKDVDGLHPISQARLVQGREGLRPCTPLGVMHLIDSTGTDIKGRRAVVVGRSLLVGKPVAFLLLERHATVTICHSRTADLAGEIGRADILVAAIGKPALVRGEWIQPGSVVIDVGINRVDGKLVGDVEFEPAAKRAGFITPVPGGVGPMTVAMLMRNTVAAAQGMMAEPKGIGDR